jgi:translation initiation factor 1
MSEKEKPFHNPFAALRGLAGVAPATGEPDVTRAPAADGTAHRNRSAAASVETSKPIPRAVVRLERSGRGGKEVTVVEHLQIATAARDEWLKALKAAVPLKTSGSCFRATSANACPRCCRRAASRR